MKFKYDKQSKYSVNWKKTLPIVFGVVLGIVILSWLGLKQWYSYNLKPVTQEYSETIVVVEPGSSRVSIGDELKELDLIRNSSVFNWYVRSSDENQPLLAGTYKFSPSFSTQEIVYMLANGEVDTSLVAVYPGRWLDQIASDLVEAGFVQSEVDEAINAKYTHPLFVDKPVGSSLEGYIFPETYQITIQSTAQDVIEHSFDVFYEQLTNEIMAGITKQGLNLYEAITLASIVQKEVSDPEVQRQVAQVFLNRLEQGMTLGSDVTFFYAAEVQGVEPTVDLDSPYNTRIHGGLPPGPISNFNISALEAVANPAEGEYLFFVAGDDGNTYFANTLSQHEANAAKYCIELCKL